jgi:AcrR family transcriptional regulator
MAYPSRKEIIQNFRTQSLLEATRSIIAAQGFAAVTMERVASEVGMTKGGIYLYFRNKDQLILAAIEEIASGMFREIEQRVEAFIPPWKKLCQAIRVQTEIMEKQQDLLRTLLLDRRILRDKPAGQQSRLVLKYRQKHLTLLKDILDDGCRQKLFPPMDTADAAFYISRMVIGVAEQRMLGLSRSPLEGDIKRILRFLALLLRPARAQWGHASRVRV